MRLVFGPTDLYVDTGRAEDEVSATAFSKFVGAAMLEMLAMLLHTLFRPAMLGCRH